MTKEQLISLIEQSENQLSLIKAIEYDGMSNNILELESTFKEFRESGEELLSKDDVLQIGIVGQVKAGKSSFLNSLFFDGENVLPKASTPMTAGLTIIEYSDKNLFEVEYFNQKDWSIFVEQNNEYENRKKEIMAQDPGAPESIVKKELERRTSDKVRSAHEMVSNCSVRAMQKIGAANDAKEFLDLEDLQNVLEQYVGANGEYTSVVKSLYIKMNDNRLQGLRIVDTPGVNDPIVSRENRTRTFLHSCHGVFLLSASSDFLGSGDVSFLNCRVGGSGIGTVVILASKFDSVLQDVGAEREMKKEGRCSLAETIESQTKKFKRRLRELSDTIDQKLRGRIKFDTTAGIGYAIAHKPESRWDNMERQVAERMAYYFPDDFSSDSLLKENFDKLANIPTIKEKYLDGLFIENKEAIIAEKVKQFFVNSKQGITETITNILSELKTREEQLNETTLAEIQRQKEMQTELFDGLKETFANTFNNFSRSLQNEIKHISNNVQFHDIRTIPTEETMESVTYKGMLWGHNTNEMRIDHVDTFALNNQVENAVSEYGQAWNTEWQKLFEKARKEMQEKLTSSIGEFERKVMSTSFKDTYYRNLIINALDELRDHQELAIGDTITRYQRQGCDIASNQFYPTGTYELKEEQVGSFLSRRLREHCSGMIVEYRNLADSLKEDIRTEVNKNLQGAISVINEMKTSFADNLKKEGEAYLSSLENDMKEKTEVLNKLALIISHVTEIANLYK